MKLSCPLCGDWCVNFTSTEVWTGPDGKPREFVDGKCARCQSRVLVKPSPQAIATARARLTVGAEMRRVAGGGPEAT